MLNKKELQQTIDFLAIITECARELLDEVVSYEALINENKQQQHKQSEMRKKRKNKARYRSKVSK